ncbi:MAG TPA: hypothetical protein PK859_10335 [Spirochaetota bacterium]|nr:hypothetical protein [Spirochaetota bacterium]
MKKIALLSNIAVFVFVLACGGGGGKSSGDTTYPRFTSDDDTIVQYAFTSSLNASLSGDATGTIGDSTIEVTVSHSTEVTALIAEFVSNSSRVEVNGVVQQSGMSANDFSSPVVYVVTAESGETRSYTVSVTKAASTEKAITAFSLDGNEGTVDEDEGTIRVDLPARTAVTALTASFSTTGSSVAVGETAQQSGVTQNDYSSPVVYTVTAEDGSSKNYTAGVTVLPGSWKEISSFAFYKELNSSITGDAHGVFSGDAISVELPYGSSTDSLIASFETTGDSVTVDDVAQEAGITANNFGSVITYTVTAEDKTTRDYDVTVTVAKNDAREITAFSIAGESADIDSDTGAISLELPADATVTALVASFAHTGYSIAINGVDQESGITANDFSNPVMYTVTAENGTTKNFTVTVVRSEEIAGLWNFETSSDGSYDVVEATEVGGVLGDALLFDGYNDYVRVEDSDTLTLAEAGTIEAVVYMNEYTPFAGIVHKGELKNFSDESYSLQFWTPDGTLRIGLFNDAGENAYVDSETTIEVGQWYYLVATWDSEEISLYINGTRDAYTANTIGTVRDSSGDLIIGSQLPIQYSSSWGNLCFSGIIDKVQISSRALTAQEIAGKYNEYFPEGTSALGAYILAAVKSGGWGLVGAFIILVVLLVGLFMRNRKKAVAE